jgi:tRNA threonylcarbamoyladenosine biosynthesis protein TsaB
MAAEPEALALGPALTGYRAALEAAGVAPQRLLAGPAFPSAVELARLVRFPETQPLETVFALEPHYVRPSESSATRNFLRCPDPRPWPASRMIEGRAGSPPRPQRGQHAKAPQQQGGIP